MASCAPAAMPNVEGSARGLRKTCCNSKPESPRPAPQIKAMALRGRTVSNAMTRCSASNSGELAGAFNARVNSKAAIRAATSTSSPQNRNGLMPANRASPACVIGGPPRSLPNSGEEAGQSGAPLAIRRNDRAAAGTERVFHGWRAAHSTGNSAVDDKGFLDRSGR